MAFSNSWVATFVSEALADYLDNRELHYKFNRNIGTVDITPVESPKVKAAVLKVHTQTGDPKILIADHTHLIRAVLRKDAVQACTGQSPITGDILYLSRIELRITDCYEPPRPEIRIGAFSIAQAGIRNKLGAIAAEQDTLIAHLIALYRARMARRMVPGLENESPCSLKSQPDIAEVDESEFVTQAPLYVSPSPAKRYSRDPIRQTLQQDPPNASVGTEATAQPPNNTSTELANGHAHVPGFALEESLPVATNIAVAASESAPASQTLPERLPEVKTPASNLPDEASTDTTKNTGTPIDEDSSHLKHQKSDVSQLHQHWRRRRTVPRFVTRIPKSQLEILESLDKWVPPRIGRRPIEQNVPLALWTALADEADGSAQLSNELQQSQSEKVLAEADQIAQTSTPASPSANNEYQLPEPKLAVRKDESDGEEVEWSTSEHDAASEASCYQARPTPNDQSKQALSSGVVSADSVRPREPQELPPDSSPLTRPPRGMDAVGEHPHTQKEAQQISGQPILENEDSPSDDLNAEAGSEVDREHEDEKSSTGDPVHDQDEARQRLGRSEFEKKDTQIHTPDEDAVSILEPWVIHKGVPNEHQVQPQPGVQVQQHNTAIQLPTKTNIKETPFLGRFSIPNIDVSQSQQTYVPGTFPSTHASQESHMPQSESEKVLDVDFEDDSSEDGEVEEQSQKRKRQDSEPVVVSKRVRSMVPSSPQVHSRASDPEYQPVEKRARDLRRELIKTVKAMREEVVESAGAQRARSTSSEAGSPPRSSSIVSQNQQPSTPITTPFSVTEARKSSIVSGSEMSFVNRKGMQAVYDLFKVTYPDYDGGWAQFQNACSLISRLRVEDKAPHPSLWDDFIFRLVHDYKDYVTEVISAGGSVAEYSKFYEECVEEPTHMKRIVRPQAIDQLDGNTTRKTRWSDVSSFLRDRSVKAESSMSNLQPRPAPRSTEVLVSKDEILVDTAADDIRQDVDTEDLGNEERPAVEGHEEMHDVETADRSQESVRLWLEKAPGMESPILGTPVEEKASAEIPHLSLVENVGDDEAVDDRPVDSPSMALGTELLQSIRQKAVPAVRLDDQKSDTRSRKRPADEMSCDDPPQQFATQARTSSPPLELSQTPRIRSDYLSSNSDAPRPSQPISSRHTEHGIEVIDLSKAEDKPATRRRLPWAGSANIVNNPPIVKDVAADKARRIQKRRSSWWLDGETKFKQFFDAYGRLPGEMGSNVVGRKEDEDVKTLIDIFSWREKGAGGKVRVY